MTQLQIAEEIEKEEIASLDDTGFYCAAPVVADVANFSDSTIVDTNSNL